MPKSKNANDAKVKKSKKQEEPEVAVKAESAQEASPEKKKKKKNDKAANAAEQTTPAAEPSAKKKNKKDKKKKDKTPSGPLDKKGALKELARLQVELVKLQEWVKHKGLKVVVLFEGRDAAGKGGAIKRITESLNPRVCRVVALGTPTEREKTQWYFQRYVAHLPAAGEMVLLDRSWYNRAGVERVMGFCTEDEYHEFLRSAPEFERMLIRSGIILIKYWFSVGPEEQERRFKARMENPTKRWKLSPMDMQSRARWMDYSKAKDEMFSFTDTKQSPWYVVNSDNKSLAHLNMIRHLLSLIPYEELDRPVIELPALQAASGYERPPRDYQTYIPEVYH
ncbi:MAG TPA: polyphosphate kinase 2 [Thermoflexales bacterium]|nr:polyphosphate kinase 2 [Thermoflexales bacterium]HQW33808.1 polyphosphate kinase 2 [Thermoflexales bacterium]HQZ21671.1 polyphosphate kinase 2 [Thermoflexales bacterium]